MSGPMLVNTDYVLLLGREIKDMVGAACSMCEGNIKYTQKVGWKHTANVHIKVIYWEDVN
jgi:hypothetical protein